MTMDKELYDTLQAMEGKIMTAIKESKCEVDKKIENIEKEFLRKDAFEPYRVIMAAVILAIIMGFITNIGTVTYVKNMKAISSLEKDSTEYKENISITPITPFIKNVSANETKR